MQTKQWVDGLAQALFNPANMNWRDYGKIYYYIVRSYDDRTSDLFHDAPPKAVVLVKRAGAWWLYRNLTL